MLGTHKKGAVAGALSNLYQEILAAHSSAMETATTTVEAANTVEAITHNSHPRPSY